MSRRWTDADLRQLAKLHAAGLTDQAIADHMACSRETVARHRRGMGLRPACVLNRGMAWSTEDDVDLCEMFYSGWTDHEIAHALGRRVRSVEYRRYDLGLSRGRGAA